MLVCAVERGEQEIHIPSGGFRLQSGDRISFVASYGGAQQCFRQMKLAAGRVRSVMLIGGGRIAYYLAPADRGRARRQNSRERSGPLRGAFHCPSQGGDPLR